MKKRRPTPVFVVASALALAVGGGVLAGCVAPQSGTDEILARLDEMQAQIDALEANQQSSTEDDSAASDTATDDSQSDSSDSKDAAKNGTSDTSSGASSASDLAAQLDDLLDRVDEAVTTAAAVEVPSNAADRPQAYFEAKAPLEELEYELDLIEDAIEVAYRQGTITRDELWSLGQQEDVIDDTLDRAMDVLEMRMGVDD